MASGSSLTVREGVDSAPAPSLTVGLPPLTALPYTQLKPDLVCRVKYKAHTADRTKKRDKKIRDKKLGIEK